MGLNYLNLDQGVLVDNATANSLHRPVCPRPDTRFDFMESPTGIGAVQVRFTILDMGVGTGNPMVKIVGTSKDADSVQNKGWELSVEKSSGMIRVWNGHYYVGDLQFTQAKFLAEIKQGITYDVHVVKIGLQYRTYVQAVSRSQYLYETFGTGGVITKQSITLGGKENRGTSAPYQKVLVHGLRFFNTETDRKDGVEYMRDIEAIANVGNYVPERLHLYCVGEWTCQGKSNKLVSTVSQYNYAKEKKLPDLKTANWTRLNPTDPNIAYTETLAYLEMAAVSIPSGTYPASYRTPTAVTWTLGKTYTLEVDVEIVNKGASDYIAFIFNGSAFSTTKTTAAREKIIYTFTPTTGVVDSVFYMESRFYVDSTAKVRIYSAKFYETAKVDNQPISDLHFSYLYYSPAELGITGTDLVRYNTLAKVPALRGIKGNGSDSSITFPDNTNALLVGKTDVLYYFHWRPPVAGVVGDFMLAANVDGASISFRFGGSRISLNGATTTHAQKNFKLLKQDLTDAIIQPGQDNRLIVHYKANQTIEAYLNKDRLSTTVKDGLGALVPDMLFNYVFAGSGSFVLMNVSSGYNTGGHSSNSVLYEAAILSEVNTATLTEADKLAITSGEYDPWGKILAQNRVFHIRPNQTATENMAALVELSPNAKSGWLVNFKRSDWTDGKTGLPELVNAVQLSNNTGGDHDKLLIAQASAGIKAIGTGDFSITFSFYNPAGSDADERIFYLDQPLTDGNYRIFCYKNRYQILWRTGGAWTVIDAFYTPGVPLPEGWYTATINKYDGKYWEMYLNGKRYVFAGAGGTNLGNFTAAGNFDMNNTTQYAFAGYGAYAVNLTFDNRRVGMTEHLERHAAGMFKQPAICLENYTFNTAVGGVFPGNKGVGNALTPDATFDLTTTSRNYKLHPISRLRFEDTPYPAAHLTGVHTWAEPTAADKLTLDNTMDTVKDRVVSFVELSPNARTFSSENPGVLRSAAGINGLVLSGRTSGSAVYNYSAGGTAADWTILSDARPMSFYVVFSITTIQNYYYNSLFHTAGGGNNSVFYIGDSTDDRTALNLLVRGHNGSVYNQHSLNTGTGTVQQGVPLKLELFSRGYNYAGADDLELLVNDTKKAGVATNTIGGLTGTIQPPLYPLIASSSEQNYMELAFIGVIDHTGKTDAQVAADRAFMDEFIKYKLNKR